MKKDLELTRDQYITLVKLVFYGEWLLNANKLKSEEKDKEGEELMEYIFSKKAEFKLGNWFKDLEYGEDIKESVKMSLLEKVFEYNEEIFTFYLIKKLSERDAQREYEEMKDEDSKEEIYDDLVYKFEEKYEKIIAESGIIHLELNRK